MFALHMSFACFASAFVAEMITEPEWRSGLRPEFAFWAGAGAGINILSSSRSRCQAKFLTCEISDFTPCTHAQSNILQRKHADKTDY